jgi:hypothetical protein
MAPEPVLTAIERIAIDAGLALELQQFWEKLPDDLVGRVEITT